MKRICPSCGREVEKLYDGLCYECYLKINKKEEKKEKVYICKYCGRIKYHNKWYNNLNIDNFEYEYTVCPRCKGLIRKANLILYIYM
jgi:NMD protein affecting ribosome stability and mRNA decay